MMLDVNILSFALVCHRWFIILNNVLLVLLWAFIDGDFRPATCAICFDWN